MQKHIDEKYKPLKLKPGYIWTSDLVAGLSNADDLELEPGGFVCRFYKCKDTPDYKDCRRDLALYIERPRAERTAKWDADVWRHLEYEWGLFLNLCKEGAFDIPNTQFYCPMVKAGTTVTDLFCAVSVTGGGDTMFSLNEYLNEYKPEL
jgi:hypothetical protein